jgi:DNA-binding NarL/FixJ family response regulator
LWDVTDLDDEPDVATPRPFTLVLSHPDASRRSLWERKLSRHPETTVILSTDSNAAAVACANDQLPDVLALAPGDDLVDSVRTVTEESPAVAILVLEPDDEDFGALTAGASGSLPPRTSELTLAVIGIARDESILTPGWAGQLADAIVELPAPVNRRVILSETEKEVIRRIAEGDSIGTIAEDHEVAERLVNLHTGFVVAKYQRAVEALTAVNAVSGTDRSGTAVAAAESGP